MTLRFQDLPVEVKTRISEFLEGKDVLSLAECVDILPSREAYTRVFPYDTQAGLYSSKQFYQRQNAEVHLFNELTHEEVLTLGLKEFHSPVTFVYAGSTACLFNIKGDVFVCLPETSYFHELEQIVPPEKAFSNWLKMLVKRRPKRVKWRELCPCGSYLLGTDCGTANYIWKVSAPNIGITGVLLSVIGSPYQEVLSQQKSLIRSGDLTDGCFAEGKGLAVWYKRGYGTVPDSFLLRSVGDYVKFVPCAIVPCTQSGVCDYALVDDFVFFITLLGTVVGMNILGLLAGEFNLLDDSFFFPELNGLASNWGGFVGIYGLHNKLALIARNGKVVVADTFWSSKSPLKVPVSVVDQLEGLVGLALGDTLNHALNEEGEVFSWSIDRDDWESQTEMVGSIKMDGPVKVDLPGRAFGISGGSEYFSVMLGK